MPRRTVQTNHLQRLKRRVIHFAQHHTLASVLIAMAVLIVTAALAFDVTESDTTDNALWRALVYAMSGIDVEPPKTVPGKILAATVVTSGVVLVSLFTGYVASAFSRALSMSHTIRRKPSKKRLVDHVIFFGWNAKVKTVLQELNPDFQMFALRSKHFVVIAEDEYLERGEEAIFKNVWHVRGSPTDPAVLHQANLVVPQKGCARIAAIFADPGMPHDEGDRRSLLALLAVEALSPETISLVEVMNEPNRQHMENAYGDEVILPIVYGANLLARTSEFPGLHGFVSELLALAPDEHGAGSPISLYVVSAKDVGAEGGTLADAVIDCYIRGKGLIIGRLSTSCAELITESPSVAEHVVSPDDALIVIATPEQLGT